MSEIIDHAAQAEQQVFGDAFSFHSGIASDERVSAFFAGRITKIYNGETAWLPRALDPDHGICADLFVDKKLIATLNFDYSDGSACVYVTSEGGDFGDTALCDRVSFAEAVSASNILARL